MSSSSENVGEADALTNQSNDERRQESQSTSSLADKSHHSASMEDEPLKNDTSEAPVDEPYENGFSEVVNDEDNQEVEPVKSEPENSIDNSGIDDQSKADSVSDMKRSDTSLNKPKESTNKVNAEDDGPKYWAFFNCDPSDIMKQFIPANLMAKASLGENELTDQNLSNHQKALLSGLFKFAEAKPYKYPKNYIRTTKYTVLTFLPVNLFNQFRRFYNIYFLAAAIFSFFPNASAISPETQVLPLVFILIITAIKDGVEDYFRHLSDKQANKTPVEMVRGSNAIQTQARNITAGDIVYVERGHPIPADLLVLSSSYTDGAFFVETSQLDGETNLKRKSAVGATKDIVAEFSENPDKAPLKRKFSMRQTMPAQKLSGAGDFDKFQVVLETEMPNNRLNQFNGLLYLLNNTNESKPSVKRIAVGTQSLALRGAELRNTDYIFGLCVYAGTDTKIIRNLSRGKLKYGSLDAKLNRLLLLMFFLNALILVVSVLLGYQWANQFIGPSKSWYLWDGRSAQETAGLQFMTYYILYTYMIPISLFITMELVRLYQGMVISRDQNLKLPTCVEGSEPTAIQVRNTTLNEELGMIEYIFSDKTGTLTKNVMTLAYWYVSGVGEFSELRSDNSEPGNLRRYLLGQSSSGTDQKAEAEMQPTENQKDNVNLLLRFVSLCHSAIPTTDPDTGEILYESESPDETAFLNNMKSNGIEVKSREREMIELDINSEISKYEILEVFEFNSDRKRMSVLVRLPQFGDKVVLLCKGADSVIFERMKSDQAPVKEELNSKIDEFSRIGLRTLVFAYRVLDEKVYEKFKDEYEHASASLKNRDEKMNEVASSLETDLELLGCSAIEDKLQDQVPETIDYLLQCGIRMWVLTGDKTETAINIAFSCKLFQSGMNVLRIEATEKQKVGDRIGEILQIMRESQNAKDLLSKEHGFKMRRRNNFSASSSAPIGLVITGEALTHALESFSEEFLVMSTMCHSVVCCRVSPRQKALVVKLVKKRLKKVTLSIGDGANDVPMIQSANIGIGIIGLEGAQAVRASDYAISQFQCLKRLLIVHGRYSFYRVSKMIYYSLYKNLAFIMVCFWFGIDSSWSGLQIYQQTFLAMYNVFFNSLPPAAIGGFEKDVTIKTIEKYPKLYTSLRKEGFFNWNWLFQYLFLPFWHSAAVYFGLYLTFNDEIVNSSGNTSGYWMQAWFASSAIMLVVMSKLSIMQKSWTWVTVLAIALSFLVYLLLMFLAEYFGFETSVGAAVDISSLGITYLSLLIILFASVLPDFMITYLLQSSFPHDTDILREETHIIRMNEKQKLVENQQA